MRELAVTDDIIAGLAAKLAALELTSEEQALLGSILATSAEAIGDVEGYGVVFEVETTFKGSDEELQRALRKATGSRFWTDMRPLQLPPDKYKA